MLQFSLLSLYMVQYVFTSIYKSGSMKKENIFAKLKKSIEMKK